MPLEEKSQYGQKLTFDVIETIASKVTERSTIQYVSTPHHGNVLLMDGEVQLSTQDEYRYHEMLVHPIMSRVTAQVAEPLDVLILGGGDGCAAREVLKWGNVGSVTIVDYDEEFVEIFGKGHLREQNRGVYSRWNVYYRSEDAIDFLTESAPSLYHVVLIDFPDPDSVEMTHLYRTAILGCEKVLKPGGGIGMHVGPASLDPNHPNWNMIAECRDTLRSAFTSRKPITTFQTCYVPSFSNEWAFLHMFLCAPQVGDTSLRFDVAVHSRYWNPVTDSVVATDFWTLYQRRV